MTLQKGEVLVSKIANVDKARLARDKLRTQVDMDPNVVGVGLTRVNKGYALLLVLGSDVGIETAPSEVNGFPVVIECVE